MPKWESKLLTQEVKNADGSVKTVGVVAWVPVDDAAKAHKQVEKAIQLKAYTPSIPNEREVMEKKLKDIQKKDLQRMGKLPRDAK